MKCLVHCSLTPNTVYWPLRSCFAALWTVPASTHGEVVKRAILLCSASIIAVH